MGHIILATIGSTPHTASTKRNTMSTQPFELLDYIAAFIPSPADLLALALTCKTFSAVIIPTHIQFRHLRCDVRRTPLWEALAGRPAIASRFAALEIADEFPHRTVIVPRSVVGAEGAVRMRMDWPRNWQEGERMLGACAQALATAVRSMSGLTRFCWTIEYPPPNDLLAALQTYSPGIVHLDVTAHDPSNLSTSLLWKFSNLSSFVWALHCPLLPSNYSPPPPYTPKMTAMLSNNCPNLQVLSLRQTNSADAEISPLLARARWPRLRDLSLIHFYGSSDAMAAFLEGHPALERLSTNHLTSVRYPAGLRRLFLHTAVSPGTKPTWRGPLEALSVPLPVSPWQDDISPLEFLSHTPPSLRSFTLRSTNSTKSFEYLTLLPKYTPHIERLDVALDLTSTPMDTQTLCSLYAPLQHLTHLGALTLTPSQTFSDAVQDVLGPLSTALPNLQFIRFLWRGVTGPPIHSDRWLAVARTPGGAYAGWGPVGSRAGKRDWGTFPG